MCTLPINADVCERFVALHSTPGFSWRGSIAFNISQITSKISLGAGGTCVLTRVPLIFTHQLLERVCSTSAPQVCRM